MVFTRVAIVAVTLLGAYAAQAEEGVTQCSAFKGADGTIDYVACARERKGLDGVLFDAVESAEWRAYDSVCTRGIGLNGTGRYRDLGGRSSAESSLFLDVAAVVRIGNTPDSKCGRR